MIVITFQRFETFERLNLAMCGRKTLTKGELEIIEELSVNEWEGEGDYQPSYNIAPAQNSPVMLYTVHRTVKLMRWGLIPSWSRGPDSRFSMINARSETVEEKPAYRNLISRNRCVVISDGYYEWKKKDGGKQPYYIRYPDESILPMAGLWDIWINPEGIPVHSYTIMTTDSAESISHIHPRMPVVLEKEKLDQWIKTRDTTTFEAINLLKPYRRELEFYPVSKFVNSPQNNSPLCIQPLN